MRPNEIKCYKILVNCDEHAVSSLRVLSEHGVDCIYAKRCMNHLISNVYGIYINRFLEANLSIFEDYFETDEGELVSVNELIKIINMEKRNRIECNCDEHASKVLYILHKLGYDCAKYWADEAKNNAGNVGIRRVVAINDMHGDGHKLIYVIFDFNTFNKHHSSSHNEITLKDLTKMLYESKK